LYLLERRSAVNEHDPLCDQRNPDPDKIVESWADDAFCHCQLIEDVIERTKERLTESLYREIEEQVREQERQRCVTRAQMAMEHRGLRWADVKAVMDHLEQR
jgi:hypothetical protein